MKTLVIGAGGFVGDHLMRALEAEGHEVIAADIEAVIAGKDHGVRRGLVINFLEPASLKSVFDDIHPDGVILLAAQSSVGYSWENPVGTILPNIVGPVNVLEAIKQSSCRPRILLIGSSEEYGAVQGDIEPIVEERALAPLNPYAVTKCCQEDFGRLYHRAFGLKIVMTRSFNHIGPGQRLGFVVPDFCSSIVSIEQGRSDPVLRVGNLEAVRDFTDVRDVVRAYCVLLQDGEPGEVYNVGSGVGTPVSRILEMLIGMSKSKIAVEMDPGKYRPIEVKTIISSIAKIKRATGWEPWISLPASLKDSLEFWRRV